MKEPWVAVPWTPPVQKAPLRIVPMPVEDWRALSKAWDTYEYCSIMQALLLGTRIELWRAN